MDKPKLFVIAGCNGSGKSSYANAITPEHLTSFDYDKQFLSFYNAMSDSELREQIAHHKAREVLNNLVDTSLKSNKDFCYETNFNSTPMYWPNQFNPNNSSI